MVIPTDISAGGGTRSISEILGLVLLFGMVAIGVATLLLFGSVAMTSLQEQATLDAAESTLHEVDGSLGGPDGEPVVVGLGQTDGEYHVVENGTLWFEVNDRPSCAATVDIGSLRYRDDAGNQLAYEVGGIWKETESGAVMVTPPDIRYLDGQLHVSLTNVSGEVDGSASELRAIQERTDSGSTSRILADLYDSPGCFPADNVTVTVRSDFYRAWGRYFEDELNASTTSVDPAAETASVGLFIDSENFSVNSSNNSVSANTRFEATVEVLGTELSGLGGDLIYYGPTTFTTVAGPDVFTPWPDGNPADGLAGEPADDDVNDPTLAERQSFDTPEYPAGTNITVRATSWYCGNYADSGQDTMVGGSPYDQYRCTDVGGERIAISSNSQSSNLVLLRDGQQVPDFNEAGPEQRNLSAILGSRIDDSGRLDLPQNEVVFLYELSQPNADPDSASGSGDPDYNDAVVLVTIEQAWDGNGDFSIRIDNNQVIIEEDDD
ncbi:DUF7289 family protein [Haloarchaeobius sp. DFWS5]|uniref:DUF7289 family protein n=1 Tax=Haloarchaeobius sp. DFWS5 TaxID=3446114 RepID=UPI003EBCBC3B